MRSATHLADPEVRARAQAARKAKKKGGRGAKMAAFPATFEAQRKQFPKMALPIIAKAEAGSLPAAVKLKCLDCAGWVKQEVRDCTISSCPLFPHRPYQEISARNPNDPGESGITTGVRERIGLATAARVDS